MVKRRARREGGADDDEGDLEAETLRAELARVRARFGLDPDAPLGVPDVPLGVLARAWVSPSGAVEEDEAEFIDALADCVSVGLPLTAAVVSWATGGLAREDDRDEDAAESRRR
jgi:hypothetical protein